MTKAEYKKLTKAQLESKLEYARQQRVAALNRRNQQTANRIATEIARITEVLAERR